MLVRTIKKFVFQENIPYKHFLMAVVLWCHVTYAVIDFWKCYFQFPYGQYYLSFKYHVLWWMNGKMVAISIKEFFYIYLFSVIWWEWWLSIYPFDAIFNQLWIILFLKIHYWRKKMMFNLLEWVSHCLKMEAISTPVMVFLKF